MEKNVSGIFSGILKNPIVLVRYYHFPFLTNIETQVFTSYGDFARCVDFFLLVDLHPERSAINRATPSSFGEVTCPFFLSFLQNINLNLIYTLYCKQIWLSPPESSSSNELLACSGNQQIRLSLNYHPQLFLPLSGLITHGPKWPVGSQLDFYVWIYGVKHSFDRLRITSITKKQVKK